MLRVPLVVVSFDAVPGASNRLVAHFARNCAVAFEGSSLPNQVLTGAPVRSAVLSADRSPSGRDRLCRERRSPPTRFILAIAGGSLGARRLNEAALGLAKSWASRGDVTIFHIAGERNLADLEGEASALGLGPERRGRGASTTGLSATSGGCRPSLRRATSRYAGRAPRPWPSWRRSGRPSVLVPLPGAPHDHQRRNAEAPGEAGAAMLLADADCTPRAAREHSSTA